MNRKQTLEAATRCVCGERQDEYGTPEDNFGIIAKLWTDYIGTPITAKDVAMMMALLKIARIKTGSATEDSFVDLAGYAACGAEIATAPETTRIVTAELTFIRDKNGDKDALILKKKLDADDVNITKVQDFVNE